jgi:hypothetical protein
MLITTGHTLSPVELAKAIEQLEAKAVMAEQRGLSHTAKSWRDALANLRRSPSPKSRKNLRASAMARSVLGGVQS